VSFKVEMDAKYYYHYFQKNYINSLLKIEFN